MTIEHYFLGRFVMFRLFLLFCLIFPSISEATTCRKDYGGTNSCVANDAPAGDCTTLGYSNKDVDGCTNYLYCPFDTSYKKCVAGGKELDCADLGYTKSDKSEWCGKIVQCPNDNTLTACVEYCVYNDICVDKTGEATASMPSANARMIYSNCSACGKSEQIVTGWECNNGYKYVTNEVNSRGTIQEPSCKKCGTKYLMKEWLYDYQHCETQRDISCLTCGYCEGGMESGPACATACDDCDYVDCVEDHYSEVTCSGGSCVYSDTCVDKTAEMAASMPANAQLKYTSCTACGQTSNIATGWECKTGYKKVTDDTDYGNCDQDFTRCLACNSSYLPYLNCQPYGECKRSCQWSGECTSCDQYRTDCDRCQDCLDECEASYYKKVQC